MPTATNSERLRSSNQGADGCQGAVASDANFAGVDARGVTLPRDMSGACCNSAQMQGALMLFGTVHKTIFFDADLINARLQHADLAGSELWHTMLTGADLTGADLTDASFA